MRGNAQRMKEDLISKASAESRQDAAAAPADPTQAFSTESRQGAAAAPADPTLESGDASRVEETVMQVPV